VYKVVGSVAIDVWKIYVRDKFIWCMLSWMVPLLSVEILCLVSWCIHIGDTCNIPSLKPMTDDPSSPSKKLVRETRTKNSVRMSYILARVFSRARNLFRVGHSSIPFEKLGVT